MAEKLIKIVANCETGIVEEIPLTIEEIAQIEIDRLAFEAQQAEQAALDQARADAKASALAKLEALGLSTEEIAAITA